MDEKFKESATLMLSADYKERFRAEVTQVDVRREKLRQMIRKWDRGELAFTPKAPRCLYEAQLYLMDGYYKILCQRAEIDGIDLS